MNNQKQTFTWFISAAVFIGRIIQMATLTLDGWLGYGDFRHFFQLADLKGLPYIQYWVEFPPFFPYLLKGIYWLSGGSEHSFYYILGFILAAVCSIGVWLLAIILDLIKPGQDHTIPLITYCLILVCLPYNWWFFDPIPVLFLLIGVYYAIANKLTLSALSFSVGGLLKWFPLIGVLTHWNKHKIGTLIKGTAISLGIVLAFYGVVWAINPQFTMSSIKSQATKGSWETIWALIDGNYQTGNFGDLAERVLPLKSGTQSEATARISPWLTIFGFAGLGAWGLLKHKLIEPVNKVAAVGWGLTLLFLWSPGWSPQWILYLIPIMLICLPLRLAWLYCLTLIGVNILEWPILLSRGWFWSLNYTIPMRFILLAMLAYAFFEAMKSGSDQPSLPTHQ